LLNERRILLKKRSILLKKRSILLKKINFQKIIFFPKRLFLSLKPDFRFF